MRALRFLALAFVLPLVLSAAHCALAAPVLRYDFTGDLPFIADLSGNGNHALAPGCTRVMDGDRPCLKLTKDAPLRLPEASLVLGTQPTQGAIELSVKPDFDPLALPEGTWDGWVVLVYFQKTSGNGLPDGYNEIGLALHGKTLWAKVVGGDGGPFAVIDTPLRQGQWTRLRLEWAPGRRALLVDGKVAAENTAAYTPPLLDAFPAFIGLHPSSHKWPFTGLVSDVTVER